MPDTERARKTLDLMRCREFGLLIGIIRKMHPEAIRPQVKAELFWLEQPLDQLAAFLRIREFAADSGR